MKQCQLRDVAIINQTPPRRVAELHHPAATLAVKAQFFGNLLIKSAIWGAAWGVIEQVSTCGVFYRAPPDTHPDAPGECRYNPSVVHARLYRRREPQQCLWLLDTGGEGIGEVPRWRSHHLRKLRWDLPCVHAMGWEIAFTRLCRGVPLSCRGGQSVHILWLSRDTYGKKK